jgi:soluble P-type ATPase
MTDEQYIVILVYSTSYALRVEKVLAKAGISCKLIPVPRQLSSDCGVCVRIARADRETALAAVEAAGVEIEGVYEI